MKIYIRRLSAFVLFVAVVAFAPPLAAMGQTRASRADAPATAEQRALRQKVEARFDVLPISDGIALRPKTRIEGVRLIEIVNSTIEIDGVAVGGRELRDKLRADAQLVLQLSYLDAAQLNELFATDRAETSAPAAEGAAPSEPAAPQPPERPAEPERTYSHETHGDRVRIMGSVHVDKGERIHGGAVAVLGSAYVNGDVNGDVVAVLGNVELGPGVRVGGNAVSVGGRVIRGEGAQVNGEITEVSVGQGVRAGDVHINPVWGGFYPWWGPWGRAARFFTTMFRLVLLLILGALVAVVAPRVVENAGERVRSEPLKSFGVGLAAQLLLIPVLIVTCVVLAISIVGIPFLLLIPFAILGLILAALVGFTGSAWTVGHLASRRLGWTAPSVVGAVALGIVAIVGVLLLGRLVGLVGGPIYAFAVLLVIIGFCIEYIAWAMGFGAALINLFNGWRARRAAKHAVATTTTTTTTTTPPTTEIPPVQG